MAVKAVREVETEVPADGFKALEQKIYRTVELLRAAREARASTEREVMRLRQQTAARHHELEALRREAISLRREREEVRARVEKMLRQIESMAAEP